MTRTLLNLLLFACLAFVLEWARVTNTSLIPTGRVVIGTLESIIESTSNPRDFVHTIDISGVATVMATAIVTVCNGRILSLFILSYQRVYLI